MRWFQERIHELNCILAYAESRRRSWNIRVTKHVEENVWNFTWSIEGQKCRAEDVRFEYFSTGALLSFFFYEPKEGWQDVLKLLRSEAMQFLMEYVVMFEEFNADLRYTMLRKWVFLTTLKEMCDIILAKWICEEYTSFGYFVTSIPISKSWKLLYIVCFCDSVRSTTVYNYLVFTIIPWKSEGREHLDLKLIKHLYSYLSHIKR